MWEIIQHSIVYPLKRIPGTQLFIIIEKGEDFVMNMKKTVKFYFNKCFIWNNRFIKHAWKNDSCHFVSHDNSYITCQCSLPVMLQVVGIQQNETVN